MAIEGKRHRGVLVLGHGALHDRPEPHRRWRRDHARLCVDGIFERLYPHGEICPKR